MQYNMTSHAAGPVASVFYWLVRCVQSDGLVTSTLCPLLSPICVFKSAIVPFIKSHRQITFNCIVKSVQPTHAHKM